MNLYAHHKSMLMLVMNLEHAVLYKTKDFKISDTIEHYEHEIKPHKRQELRMGRSNKPGVQAHFYDPHGQEARDLDRRDFCRDVMEKVNHYILNKKTHDGIIIMCGPKILGDLRMHFNKPTNNIKVHEIIKDINPRDIFHLEEGLKLEFKALPV